MAEYTSAQKTTARRMEESLQMQNTKRSAKEAARKEAIKRRLKERGTRRSGRAI